MTDDDPAGSTSTDSPGTDPALAPFETDDTVHRLEFDVSWPPFHVAAYLVEGPEPILIDAGPPGGEARTALVDQLLPLGYEPADIDHVVLTHPHVDHVGQVPTLRASGAAVYAAAAVCEQLSRSESALEAGVREVGSAAGYEGDDLDDAVGQALESLQRNRELVEPDRTISFPANGEFAVGNRQFRAIRTPGHQQYHASLETSVDGAPVCFSGDALIESFRPGILHVGLDHGAYDAVDAFHRGLDRLAESGATRVYPGHGPVFDDRVGVVELTRRRLDRLVAGTRDALGTVEPATPVEIATERVGEIQYALQLLDTMGALGTLEAREDVTVEVDEGRRYYRLCEP